jgi:hypothetical protein
MPLSAAELDIVESLAYPLPRASRAAFAAAVTTAVEGYPEPARGAGLTWRVACQLQRSYLDPPKVTGQSQFFNVRKFAR